MSKVIVLNPLRKYEKKTVSGLALDTVSGFISRLSGVCNSAFRKFQLKVHQFCGQSLTACCYKSLLDSAFA